MKQNSGPEKATSIISPISGLSIHNNGFSWNGRDYSFADISGIQFTATVTRNSLNGIPTGRTYEVSFSLRMMNNKTESIRGKSRTFRSGITQESFNELQKASAIISHLSFTHRIKKYETQYAAKGFFDYCEYQFHKDGEIFRNGRYICSLWHTDIKISKRPFSIVLEREGGTIGTKLRRAFLSDAINIPTEWDQDCFLYMLNDAFKIRFQNSPIPEKIADRRCIFYTAVIRYGAALANIDGNADANELNELKRFFDIDGASISDAARLFNEELAARSSVTILLRDFAEVFQDALELKETFLVGMCSVSLADGNLHSSEITLLREAARVLGLGQDSVSRAFLAAGFDFEAFLDEARRPYGSDESPSADRTDLNLKILGIEPGCSVDEIKSAYRILVKRYHPDRIRSQGLPEAEITKMEAILVKINLAYGELMREASKTT